MIRFSHTGQEHTVAPGGSFARPREQGFRDTPSADLQSLIAEIESGRPWLEAVAGRYQAGKPWLYRIITDASRTAFFDTVLPGGSGPVLDIGSGWGQIARPLARRRPVVALEPVAERLAFIQAAARQDQLAANMAFLEADYFDLDFQSRFAAICAIGVLEWTGAFQDAADPQDRQRAFLRKARAELAPGGSLIVGIENRVGLKYLLGCPDDHLGVPYIGCLPAPLARSLWQSSSGHPLRCFTYSQAELEEMLRTAGFQNIEFFAAFPDYKLPRQIVPFGPDGQQLNEWLRHQTPPPEHNGYDGSDLPAGLGEELTVHYRRLAHDNTAHTYVPSFFVRAS